MAFMPMEIVVVGCKGFGQVHLRSIRNADIGIVERDPEVRRKILESFDVAHIYDSYEDALNSKAEIMDLAVPHNLHFEMATAAMRRGKHVTIEKPISTTLGEARDMIETSRRNGVKFMVLEQYFLDPSVREAMRIVKSGSLGKIHTIIIRDQRLYSKEGWRTEASSMGGGALIDGGIHYIDTMLNIGGPYVDLWARSVHGGSSLSGEDTTSAVFAFSSGATGLFYYSWSYRNPPILPGLEVIGSDGSLYEDISSRSREDFKNSQRKTAFGDLVLNGKKLNVQPYDVFQAEFDQFLDSVTQDTQVPYDPELAYRDLEAVLKIYGQNRSMN
jgi:Predicted dehydrogenases and related proteins